MCIVTTGCLSSAPRVVKEARALAAAGHDVCVVGTQSTPELVAWDREMVRRTGIAFAASRIDGGTWGSHILRYHSALRDRVHRRLPGLAGDARTAFRLYPELLRRAAARDADLYIGHNLGALPVVAKVAAARGAAYAFDAEDDHAAQGPATGESTLERTLAIRLQATLLPGAAYVTAASDPMGQALAARYGIGTPTTIFNTFPPEADAGPPPAGERGAERVSFYWFSQTIGPGRGLETALDAAGAVNGDFALHLRGNLRPDYRAALTARIERLGLGGRVHFHGQVPPWALPAASGRHDVGLALESGHDLNNLNTVSNKFFLYMLVGLAVLASATPGQAAALRATPEAGRLFPPEDAPALAALMQALVDDPALLAGMKRGAAAAAAGVWSWESQAKKLVDLVAAVPARRRGAGG